MKKIITVLLFTFCLSGISIAGENKNGFSVLDIFSLQQDKPGYVQWLYKEVLVTKAFTYNKQKFDALYTPGEKLIGFCRTGNTEILCTEMLLSLQRRYKGCTISKSVIFVENDGNIHHYAGIRYKNKYIIVAISDHCKTKVVRRISMF